MIKPSFENRNYINVTFGLSSFIFAKYFQNLNPAESVKLIQSFNEKFEKIIEFNENFINWYLTGFGGAVCWATIGNLFLNPIQYIVPERYRTQTQLLLPAISSTVVIGAHYLFEVYSATMRQRPVDNVDIVWQTAGALIPAIAIITSNLVENTKVQESK